MADLLDKLRGGDLRSIGRSNEVAAAIDKQPALIDEVFPGLQSDDPVVRARAADVIEKATRQRPELLSKHKAAIIALLKHSVQQEVCWHIAQLIPRLKYTPREQRQVFAALQEYLSHHSKIVQASTLEALVDLAQGDEKLLDETRRIIQRQMKTGSPAVQARGRKLLQRLGGL